MSQTEAARRAGISLATWRRGEADINAVGAATRQKIDKVLAAAAQPVHSWVPLFNKRFRGDPLTPREAHLLATELTMNGETFQLDDDSVWDSHVLRELPDAVLMSVAERPQWHRRLLATSQELGARIDDGWAPRAENLAEAAALRIALTSPSLEDDSDLTGLGYESHPRDLDHDSHWPTIKRALIPPRLQQALVMLDSARYAAHLLAPMNVDSRIITSPLHPDRWWEKWTDEAQEWLHAAATGARPSQRETGSTDFDDNPSQSQTMAWGIFELLAEREADLDLLLGGALRKERTAQIADGSTPAIVLETHLGDDVVIKVSCRDHRRPQQTSPCIEDTAPVRSAILAWGLLDLLDDTGPALQEVFEGDLLPDQLTVTNGSVLVLPDASGFDLLLAVAFQERTRERSAAVDEARASWWEYQRELEEEFAAFDMEYGQD
ncbi:hypothetical protein O4J56_01780 [Nocardiopsis sp. RSe5-2]|uniref:XRE family transcriptional regulator n=1 Tax=Nocardiopsis endophytica TaxID=3018445 RepID=A0ABT4TXC8_9ACTN|nr:hypothetical protein [Nocardiopsis endophytica]MDA2809354.1 hypothetical protein [Nocardiopsis endophytica]